MFTGLTVLYYFYFVYDAKTTGGATTTIITLPLIASFTLKTFAFTAWPFALLAALDPDWRNQDAANVLLAAYITANVIWYHRTGCAFCLLPASFKVIPYVFCAWVAHSLGALRFRAAR